MLKRARYAFNDHVISGVIDHARSDDLSSPAAHYDLSLLRGTNQSLGIGIEKGTFSKVNFQLGINRQAISNFSTDMGYVKLSFSDTFEDFGAKKADEATIAEGKSYVEKETWTGRDFGALALSYFIGFGSGHGIQRRWNQKGKYFAVAEGLSVAALLSQLSINNGGMSTQNAGTAAIVFGVARVWEFVDVIWYASKSTVQKRDLGVSFVPGPSPAVVTTYRF